MLSLSSVNKKNPNKRFTLTAARHYLYIYKNQRAMMEAPCISHVNNVLPAYEVFAMFSSANHKPFNNLIFSWMDNYGKSLFHTPTWVIRLIKNAYTINLIFKKRGACNENYRAMLFQPAKQMTYCNSTKPAYQTIARADSFHPIHLSYNTAKT